MIGHGRIGSGEIESGVIGPGGAVFSHRIQLFESIGDIHFLGTILNLCIQKNVNKKVGFSYDQSKRC